MLADFYNAFKAEVAMFTFTMVLQLIFYKEIKNIDQT